MVKMALRKSAIAPNPATKTCIQRELAFDAASGNPKVNPNARISANAEMAANALIAR
jgi:hypothetical protein